MSFIIEKTPQGQYKVSARQRETNQNIEMLFDRLPCYKEIVEQLEKELRLK